MLYVAVQLISHMISHQTPKIQTASSVTSSKPKVIQEGVFISIRSVVLEKQELEKPNAL